MSERSAERRREGRPLQLRAKHTHKETHAHAAGTDGRGAFAGAGSYRRSVASGRPSPPRQLSRADDVTGRRRPINGRRTGQAERRAADVWRCWSRHSRSREGRRPADDGRPSPPRPSRENTPPSPCPPPWTASGPASVMISRNIVQPADAH